MLFFLLNQFSLMPKTPQTLEAVLNIAYDRYADFNCFILGIKTLDLTIVCIPLNILPGTILSFGVYRVINSGLRFKAHSICVSKYSSLYLIRIPSRLTETKEVTRIHHIIIFIITVLFVRQGSILVGGKCAAGTLLQ